MLRLTRALALAALAVAFAGCGEDEGEGAEKRQHVITEEPRGALVVTPEGPLPANGEAAYELTLSLHGPGGKALANVPIALDVQGRGKAQVEGDEKTNGAGEASFRVTTRSAETFVALIRAELEGGVREVARAYLAFSALEPVRLEFVEVPGSVGAGRPFEAEVAVLDENDNGVPGALAVRIEAEGVSLEGGGPVWTGNDGIARFPGLRVARTGQVQLVAVADGIPPVSRRVIVTASAPAAIEFLDGPFAGRTGEPLGPIEVRVVDAGGNEVDDGTRVQFALMRGASLMASSEAFTEGGVATAIDLEPTLPGNHRIVATAGMVSVESELVPVATGLPDRDLSLLEIRAGIPAPGAPLEVEALLVDAFGSPMRGIAVEWVALDGGMVEPPNGVSDASGVVRATWTLGPSFGEQRLQLRLDDAWPAPLELAVDLRPDALAGLEVISGEDQVGNAGEALPEKLVVRAVDEGGDPIAGVPVRFEATEGGADFTPELAFTDADGLAEVVAVPTQGGTLVVEAKAWSFTAVFEATVHRYELSRVEPQTTVALEGSSGIPVGARLTDRTVAMAGETVEAQLRTGNAILSDTQATTDVFGVARFEIDALASDTEVELSAQGQTESFAIYTIPPQGNITCQIFSGRVQTFAGAQVDHALDDNYRILAAQAPGEPDVLLSGFFDSPPGMPWVSSISMGFGVSFGDPANPDEFVSFNGSNVSHPLAVNPMDIGQMLVGEHFVLTRMSDSIGRLETTAGGAPLVITFTWAPGSSYVVESDLAPGAGGAEGLCGRNDGSDDEANFAAETPISLPWP